MTDKRFVDGLINLRGQILTVIDLRRRLGLPDGAAPGSAQPVDFVHKRDLPVSLLRRVLNLTN